MATVVFSTAIENVDATLTSAQLVDTTDYTTQGVARNTLTVYAFLVKRDVNNSDSPITIDNSNPLSAIDWSFDLPSQDGNFVAQMFGFPIWSAGTYMLNQCVYKSGDIYFCNQPSTTETPSMIATDWTNIPVDDI